MLDAKEKKSLSITANKIRIGAIEAVHGAKSGHPGGSLSIADLLSYLYFKEMNVRPSDPKWEDRDRLVLSKGHTAPGLYAALALKGYFPYEELSHLRQANHMLQGHPDMKGTPGVDMTTGSLGQGISAASGMALAAKVMNKSYRVYAIVGDGELQEGQVWEAAMFSAHNKLDNFIAIIDNNNLQIDGQVCDICSPYPIVDKWEAFGWHTITADAHDLDSLDKAFTEAKTIKGKPVTIIQNSVKGKGVSFMENNGAWHGAAPNDEQFAQAMDELNAHLKGLEG